MKRRVLQDFIVDDGQAPVGEVAMAGDRGQLALEHALDPFQVVAELHADGGKAAAQHVGVVDMMALGEIGHFLEVVACLAAVGFDLAHQAEVQCRQAEIVAGCNAVPHFDGKHLGGRAQVAVDVVPVHHGQAAPLGRRWAQELAQRQLVVAEIAGRVHQQRRTGSGGTASGSRRRVG
ncbi:hypothetical protein LP419_02955 [Massilia sp. H-1]|nr:hypothetical protein LP419_02955 [Massilia sp. H-1]